MKKELYKILTNYIDGQFLLFGINNFNLNSYIDKIVQKATIFTIGEDGEILGFIAFYNNDPDRINAYITMLAVELNNRRNGLGKMLIGSALNYLRLKNFKDVQLEVLKDNSPALKLYEKVGFIVIEERGEFYRMKAQL